MKYTKRNIGAFPFAVLGALLFKIAEFISGEKWTYRKKDVIKKYTY